MKVIIEEAAEGTRTSRTGAVIPITIIQISKITEVISILMLIIQIRITLTIVTKITIGPVTSTITIIILVTITIIIQDGRIITNILTDPRTKAEITHRSSTNPTRGDPVSYTHLHCDQIYLADLSIPRKICISLK